MVYLDDDGSNDIDIDEFAKAFKVVDKDNEERYCCRCVLPVVVVWGFLTLCSLVASGDMNSWQQSVAAHIANTIYDNRQTLKRAFQFFDVDSVGVIPAEEFYTGLEATNEQIGSPLSNLELDTLMRHVVRDDGLVNYVEFCEKWRRKR